MKFLKTVLLSLLSSSVIATAIPVVAGRAEVDGGVSVGGDTSQLVPTLQQALGQIESVITQINSTANGAIRANQQRARAQITTLFAQLNTLLSELLGNIEDLGSNIPDSPVTGGGTVEAGDGSASASGSGSIDTDAVLDLVRQLLADITSTTGNVRSRIPTSGSLNGAMGQTQNLLTGILNGLQPLVNGLSDLLTGLLGGLDLSNLGSGGSTSPGNTLGGILSGLGLGTKAKH